MKTKNKSTKLFGINNQNDRVKSLNEIINWIKSQSGGNFTQKFVDDATLTLLIKKMLLIFCMPQSQMRGRRVSVGKRICVHIC